MLVLGLLASMVATAVNPLMQGSASGQSVEKEPTLEEFMCFWNARDSALESARISFVAEARPPLGITKISSRWEGTWAMRGKETAVHWNRFDLQRDGTLALSETKHAVWDGSRLHTQVVPPKGRRTEIITNLNGGPFMAWMPLQFGIFPPSNYPSWSGYLAVGHSEIIGKEVVQGRECFKVLWYIPNDNGEPGVANHLWVDGQTWLVWKHVTFQTVTEGVTPKNVITVLNTKFSPATEFSVLDARKMKEFWVATKGVFRFLDNPKWDEVHVSMGDNSMLINDPSLQKDFEVEQVAGTIIHDGVRNMTFYSTETKGMFSAEESSLEKALVDIGQRDGLHPSPHSGTPQSLVTASCGPNALYFWARLHGYDVAIADIVRHVGPDNEAVSLQELSDAAGALIRPLVPVRVDSKSWGCPSGNFIAHLQGLKGKIIDGHSEEHGHYVVARRIGNEVRVVSTPGNIQVISEKDFFQIWSGYALAPAESLQVSLAKSPWAWMRILFWGLGGVCIVAGAILLFRVFRRQKLQGVGVGAAASILLVWAALASGCSKTSGNASLLEIVGGGTFEFAPIREGQFLMTEFKFRNVTKENIALSLKKSCGCTSATLSAPVLKPGEEAKIAVEIDTRGKGGGFHQYVEVLGLGQSLLTFWIVGKVIPGLYLVSTPPAVDIGTLRSGDEIDRTVTIEAISSGEDVPVLLGLEDAAAGSPLVWSAKWDKTHRKEQDYRRNIRKYYSCTVHIRANAVSEREILPLVFSSGTGDSRIALTIPISGRVKGPVDVTPEMVFVGDVRQGDVNSRSIIVKPVNGPLGTPTTTCSTEWLKVKGLKEVPGGYAMDVEWIAAAKPGLMRGEVAIRWGSVEAIVPVVGVRR